MATPGAVSNSAGEILLGASCRNRPSFGFGGPGSDSESPELLNYSGESHLMTVAPTGAGKGVSSIVPTLLDYPGSVIVFDPKGENLQVTRRRREELGQRVIALNPFGVLTEKSDSLNPFDLLHLEGADLESDAQMLARMLAAENSFTRDPFWDNCACGVLSGLIAHYASWHEDSTRSLNAVHQQFHGNDVVYDLAVLLDTIGKQMNRFAYSEIGAFLQHPERETRPSVQSTAASYLKSLSGGRVPDLLEKSSFSLQDFVNGEPISIYIVVPPGKLASHRGLLRLLVATLMAAVLTREARPEHATLFLLDEAAQLGHFPLLEKAVTLARGYGLKVWSFWQDLSQLMALYPYSWKSLVNNCDVKQVFGVRGMFMAREWAAVLEHSPEELIRMADSEQLLVFPDGSERIASKLNYLTDQRYAGLFDLNPRYATTARKRKRPVIQLPADENLSSKSQEQSDVSQQKIG